MVSEVVGVINPLVLDVAINVLMFQHMVKLRVEIFRSGKILLPPSAQATTI